MGDVRSSITIILDETLSNIGGVGTSVVLLPVPTLGAEKFLNGRKELIEEQASVNLPIDVAVHDERSNKSMPRDGAVHVYGGWMSVLADRFRFIAVEGPLPVIPGVIFEFSADESGVGTDDSAVPELGFGIHEIAVSLAELKVAWLERDSARSCTEGRRYTENVSYGLNRDTLLLGDSSWTELPFDDGVGDGLTASL